MNNWKEIWNKRSADKNILTSGDEEKIIIELKRSNGFDVYADGPDYKAWIRQYKQIKRELSFSKNRDSYALHSVFEVGCGSGVNLYLFEKDGIHCGGLDYSQGLIDSAREVLASDDLTCDEAINVETNMMYDAVISNGVFSYFTDEVYALSVLEKMYKKAKHSIGLTHIFSIEKKEAFITHRKSTIEDYEERYKDLPNLFYAKKFFLDFALEHGMDIKFAFPDVPNYWNNDFVFNCYMYKEGRTEQKK